MKKLQITAPERLEQVTIELPPSKSIANRMLIISALNGVMSSEVLSLPLVELCDDIRVLAELLQSTEETINVGAAGTAMRFATAYLSVTEGTHVITGTERLKHRPIGILVDALRQLGAQIDYVGEEGYPPLRIVGCKSLQGGTITLDGGVSSQFISALLMIAPVLKQGLTLKLDGQLVSVPYIDITIELMRRFGAEVSWIDSRTIVVAPGYHLPSSFKPLIIEPDWTAASYWSEIAELAGLSDVDIFLKNLNDDSLQGDRVSKEIFRLLRDYLNREKEQPFCYDFEACPDLVQTLVVTCCISDCSFYFTGLRTLRIKETDRIAALQTELAKLGYQIVVTDDSMRWDGMKTMKGTDNDILIATYHDHRMAMAFAPCALKLGSITIEDPEVVTKSYPTYWRDLEKVGFKLCYF